MAPRHPSLTPFGLSRFLCRILMLCFLSFSGVANALAYPLQDVLEAAPFSNAIDDAANESLVSETGSAPERSFHEPILDTLQDLVDALQVMQDKYFVLWQGTWPTSIDWTAAVLGTHVSAVLSTLTSGPLDIHYGEELLGLSFFALENTVNRFFSHTSAFYFGENAFSLRNQAYDDMLWVVLGWLENIKLQNLHSDLHYITSTNGSGEPWHGTQFQNSAAHRARIFYELASAGWDKTLCDGGMIWNPYLVPYKNAITNELYISASIEMYLYFPGDSIDSPFLVNSKDTQPHDPLHLKAAVDGYNWLKNSSMTGLGGLYADGFHISGWKSASNPGSKQCDQLNTMVYTYNQGVILSGLRGLWLATNSQDYLHDGHELVRRVLQATGWPHTASQQWQGLGRGGVLEDACDSRGVCSQDGQTFKGIFFHHLAEFCRPLHPQEKRFLAETTHGRSADDDWTEAYEQQMQRCRSYGAWIEHNAQAALMTRDADGKFGTWWGRPYHQMEADGLVGSSTIPDGAVDYRNSHNDSSATECLTFKDYNDRGRGRTVESQSGGIAVLRALYQWQSYDAL
ncbi:hypothetical protein N7535_000505 [Penicillium sp. DV-2018c]|nr:hypothetical protein N7461_006249 [Penicillium sp. DV-2018c]KAJ5581885.1 hypothetical protein N7535_000505 [Penicillium sp. DV-2018c]